MRQRLAIILATAGCVAVSGFGSATAHASAGIAASVTKRTGLAGYYFTVSKTTTTLIVRGRVKVPAATCGSGTHSFGLQIGAGFTRSGLHQDAIVLLELACRSGNQVSGTAQLVAGYDVVIPARTVSAGQVLQISASVRSWGGSFAKIVYPGGGSAAVWGPGGRPTGVDYALTLPGSQPPRYSPVTFSGCTVNHKTLAAFHPKIWESVTASGAIDGRVGSLTGGTAFAITY
jgi:hypothetical protein